MPAASQRIRILGFLLVAFLAWRAVDSARLLLRRARLHARLLTPEALSAPPEARIERVLGDQADLFRFVADHVPERGCVHVFAGPGVEFVNASALLFPRRIRSVRGSAAEWTLPPCPLGEGAAFVLDVSGDPGRLLPSEGESGWELVAASGDARLYRPTGP